MGTGRNRLVVSIYSEEYGTIAKKLGIKEDEISSKEIRLKLGLKASGKTTGINTQIRAGLKEKLPNMTDEEKKELLTKLGYPDGKIVEPVKPSKNAGKKK